MASGTRTAKTCTALRLLLQFVTALVLPLASGADVRFSLKDQPVVLLAGVKASIDFDLLAAGIELGTEILVEAVDSTGEPDSIARSSALANTGNIMGRQSIIVESELTQVSTSLAIRSTSAGTKDIVFLVRLGWNGTIAATESIEDLRTIPGVLCLLPTVVILITAIRSRNVVLALFAGLFVGGILISPGYNPLLGFMRAGDTFLYDGLSGADQGMLLFTWFMSGLVGLISKNGGALGLGRAFAPLATSGARAQVLAVCAGCAVFFDDYASILITGPTMRPVTDQCGVSRAKLAFIVDTTAAPVASLAVLSTWVGFKLSVVQQQLAALGVHEDGLSVIVRSIPYCFYPLFAICFAFVVAASGLDFGPMLLAEQHARAAHRALLQPASDPRPVDVNLPVACTHDPDAGGPGPGGTGMDADVPSRACAEPEDSGDQLEDSDPALRPDASKPARAVNAVGPVLLMLVAMVYGVAASGVDGYYRERGAGAVAPSGVEVLSAAATTETLIWASLLANAAAAGLSWAQGLLSAEACMAAWVAGIQQVTLGLLTLVHAWAIGDMAAKLHLGGYVASLLGNRLAPGLLPPVCFLAAAAVSVASGSSWGAMVLLFPLVLPLSLQGQASRDGAGELLVHTVGATISGSLFGDHVSPISDTTVLSALSARCPLLDHVRTQAPYASLAAAVAFAVTFLVSLCGAWALYPALVAGVALLWLVLRAIGSPADAEGRGGTEASGSGMGGAGLGGRSAQARLGATGAAPAQRLWERFRAWTGRCVRGEEFDDSERLFASEGRGDDDRTEAESRSERRAVSHHDQGRGVELQAIRGEGGG